MSVYESGLSGEDIASQYLLRQGLKLLQTRYRALGGEVDIIALDGDELCFIEVKYRPKGQKWSGIESVTQDKRERLYRAARHYLNNVRRSRRWRYDIVEITADGILYAKGAAAKTRAYE